MWGQSWENCFVTGHLSVCSAGTQQGQGGAGLGVFIARHPKNRTEVGQLGKAVPKSVLPFNLPPVFLTSCLVTGSLDGWGC